MPRRASFPVASVGVASTGAHIDPGVTAEISDVLSGLNQFKTELLQLHAVVCVMMCDV